MRIGIIGGTGREGRGLAIRWGMKGHCVVVGSRDAARAEERAREMALAGYVGISGADNESAVRESEIVVLSVPYAAHDETLRQLKPLLAGKILVDITVPIKPPKVTEVSLPRGGAAALEAREICGPGVSVVAALHHVSSAHLSDPAHALDCDVLVCSDNSQATETVIALIEELGTRAFDAGPLANAVALEALTPVLLYLNKRYKVIGAGIRLTQIQPTRISTHPK